MRYFLNRVIFITFIFINLTPLPAQELQYELSKDRKQISMIIDQTTTKFTVAKILQQKMGRPLPESQLYSLNVNMDTIGQWVSLSKNEYIWKLSIQVPQSKGFFLSFDDFYLPEDGLLYVYNKNELKESAIYSHYDNPNGGAYSIENLTGDNVILEYLAPANKSEKPRLHFARVGYKYTENESDELSGFDSSDNSCMINVNCPEGASWLNQKKGVVQLRMTKSDNKTYLCSGTLINNVKNDKTPYILTANHCFDNMTKKQIGDNTEFFFEYESPECDQNTLPKYKYHKGSEFITSNPINGSDGALLKLSEDVPEDWDVYFNGWNVESRNTNIKSGVVIHHPWGDIKKITFFDQAPRSGKWSDFAQKETHWLVNYSLGATRGGSSGSPLFNQNGLIVGTLTGGGNSCSNPSATDYYGKFWYHWDQDPDTDSHMKPYLDPENTGTTVLSGLFNNENIDQELLLAKSTLNLLLNSSESVRIINGNGTYTVSSGDNNIASASISGNSINIKGNNTGTTQLIIKDKKEKTKTIDVFVHRDVDFTINENKELIVKIHKENDLIEDIYIFNLDGDTLYKIKNAEVASHTINISYLKRGLYVIQVRTKQGTKKSEKIIW
ncbi:MAG: trypsin-like peptidase domain-containing protein [Prevotella sp.]|jgi:V8-like Glu-specific endopeptidase|nr:trypsin-like peptidase domain-containing protein [Prevotella sp.]